MNRKILPLTLGGLSIGTTEFVMMGILPQLAESFKISISEAGHFISLYALGVVIGAPLIVFLSGRWKPKKILLILMVLFTFFNSLSLLSWNAEFMNVTRLLSGLPHGAFFGVGSVVASRMAKQGQEAKNISMMFLGLTIANLIMVPLGTYLGQHFSWHIPMALVGLIGLITCLSIYFQLPDLPIKNQANISQEIAFFKTKEAWIITAMIAIGTGGAFAWLSYIAPLVTKVAGEPEQSVSIVMVLVGLGMVIGNLLGGRLADRVPAVNACIYVFSAIAINLFLVFFLAHIPWMMYILSFTTGAAMLALASPMQVLMISTAGDSEMVAAATNHAAFNIGNSLGAFLGGLVISLGFASNYSSLIGGVLACLGIAFAFILYYIFFQKTTKVHLPYTA